MCAAERREPNLSLAGLRFPVPRIRNVYLSVYLRFEDLTYKMQEFFFNERVMEVESS